MNNPVKTAWYIQPSINAGLGNNSSGAPVINRDSAWTIAELITYVSSVGAFQSVNLPPSPEVGDLVEIYVTTPSSLASFGSPDGTVYFPGSVGVNVGNSGGGGAQFRYLADGWRYLRTAGS
jgi:hypothetical protein